jgi:hypothetical protein
MKESKMSVMQRLIAEMGKPHITASAKAGLKHFFDAVAIALRTRTTCNKQVPEADISTCPACDAMFADAVPLGIEFMDACADLAEDFGYEIVEREFSAVENLIPIDSKTK